MTNLVWAGLGLKSGRRVEKQTINRRSHGTAPTQAWQGQEFQSCQTDTGAHPASHAMGAMGAFPWDKAAGA